MAPKSSQRNGVECHGINGSSMPWGKGRGCRSSSSSRTKHDLLILVASVSVLSEIRQNLQIHCGGLRRRHCFLHQTCSGNDFPLRCSTWLKVAWSNAPSRFEKHRWSCRLEAYIDVGGCNIRCNLLPNGMHFIPVADPKQPWPWDISTWKPSAPQKVWQYVHQHKKGHTICFCNHLKWKNHVIPVNTSPTPRARLGFQPWNSR